MKFASRIFSCLVFAVFVYVDEVICASLYDLSLHMIVDSALNYGTGKGAGAFCKG